MIKKVLIVDDDQEMLLSLKEGLEKYNETFSVLMAGDGLIAMEKLKEFPISLVVTDLKMPRMDGFTLLARIMERYPDIPVIIMTGYSTPEMQKLARKGGAVGYIEKPFMIEDLARKIMTAMRKESEGGTLHGVSSGMFLQLIEMEQKTCTIRLVDKSSGKQGVLFFRDGELLDARINGLQGVEAAYEIFSWDEVTLSIQNVCPQKEKKIESDLQVVLLEAMRLKDEAEQIEKPKIVTPYYLSRLEGFSTDAKRYFDMLIKTHGSDTPGLFYTYKNEPKGLNIVSDNWLTVVNRINDEIDRRGDPLASIIKGEDELWDVSLMKFIYELTRSSLQNNLTQLGSRGLLHIDASGVPADARLKIEELFRQVARGELQPYHLERELHRWDVFEEYQDRFFALVKGRK